jgi:uncharacterized protein HemX
LAGLNEALRAAKAQNEDLVGRLDSAERLSASHRVGLPLWILLAGILLALGAGAAGTYFAREGAQETAEVQARVRALEEVERQSREQAEQKRGEAERGRVAAESKLREVEQERAEAERGRVAAESKLREVEQRRPETERRTAAEAERKPAMQDTALEGRTFSTLYGLKPDQCRANCIAQAKCKGYQISINACYLFESVSHSYSSPGSISQQWD